MSFNLREFQGQLTERLKAAAAQPDVTSRLGFASAGRQWLVPLTEVDEVLPVPAVLPVPGCEGWFRGLCNVRGNLYAVSDLGYFLNGQPSTPSPHNRLLLAHRRLGVNTALVIERTLGLRHDGQLRRQEAGDVPWTGQTLVDQQETSWLDFSLAALVADTRFLAVQAQ